MSVPAHTEGPPPALVEITPSGALRPYVDFLTGRVRSLTPETRETLAKFSKITDALRHLLEAPESDEFGPVRPTSQSIEITKQTLFPLVQQGFRLPEAIDIGTDHDGDLRIVWENGPRFLELVVPYEHDAAPYFYYSYGDQYNLQRDLTLPALRERFNWLNSRGS